MYQNPQNQATVQEGPVPQKCKWNRACKMEERNKIPVLVFFTVFFMPFFGVNSNITQFVKQIRSMWVNVAGSFYF